uniref:Retrovirus-related Pol polyprotein from transposon 17.6 n=1 Tax=Tanacetum cinerariifolium TaxID=118510 RepID=A0A6L2KR67_TANCI|nr:retrovirus-related Pol polyprotein from transposon 17.6 [Tanacetum cinerariifolium]
MGEIRGFAQHPYESPVDDWLRIKDLLRSCHGHGLQRGTIIQIFYHGLDEATQAIHDARRNFLYKTPNEAHRLLEDRVLLKLNWSKDIKAKPLWKIVAFAKKDHTHRWSVMTNPWEDLKMKKPTMPTKDIKEEDIEKTTTVGVPETSMTVNQEMTTEIPNLEKTTLPIHQHQKRNPKNPNSEKPCENFTLPHNTQNNPKPNPTNDKPCRPPPARNEHVKAIFTRSGKTYDPLVNLNAKTTIIHDDSKNEDAEAEKEVESSSSKQSKSDSPPLKAINVLIVEVLAGMPNYRKFLKDLVSNKSKMEKISVAFLNEECSTIIQNKLPPNLGDHGSFLISCTLANSIKFLTLADLGASINLMPYSLYALLSENTLKPTRMSLEIINGSGYEFTKTRPKPDPLPSLCLANHTYQYPMGVAENMLIQVGKLVFPVDFVILQMKKDDKKTFDIPGIGPSSCKHKINFEDDAKPVIQRQRRLNPKMKEVIKNEIIRLLDAGIIYPIEDSPWENTTFTCPYGTYAYKRMPFGLCNAPATFKMCMIAIFQDMLETSMEVFIDDFWVFGDSFDSYLANLKKMFIRSKQDHLVLNWEKCHFMETERIVLGHKVPSAGLEVDKTKINVIAKLPPPTNVKVVRSFLGHEGFYRRFIKDFSKISCPMTKLLEKDAVFDFNKECIEAFESLKEKLKNAPIMVSPDWSQPFELIYDASNLILEMCLHNAKENSPVLSISLAKLSTTHIKIIQSLRKNCLS